MPTASPSQSTKKKSSLENLSKTDLIRYKKKTLKAMRENKERLRKLRVLDENSNAEKEAMTQFLDDAKKEFNSKKWDSISYLSFLPFFKEPPKHVQEIRAALKEYDKRKINDVDGNAAQNAFSKIGSILGRSRFVDIGKFTLEASIFKVSRTKHTQSKYDEFIDKHTKIAEKFSNSFRETTQLLAEGTGRAVRSFERFTSKLRNNRLI